MIAKAVRLFWLYGGVLERFVVFKVISNQGFYTIAFLLYAFVTLGEIGLQNNNLVKVKFENILQFSTFPYASIIAKWISNIITINR